MFSYHTDVISSYCKASYQSFLLKGNLKLLRITVHSSDSFTLSFFLFSSCSTMASNCLRRRTTCVLFRPHLDIVVSTVCSIQGCHLYRSIFSMMLTMFQSLQSFPLHHFLSPKLTFLHAVESLSPSLVRSC